MSYTFYSIVPSAQSVTIDGQVANNVSMTGIPLNVNAIQWNGVAGVGTIEYVFDPLTNTLPPPGQFTDPTIYDAQIIQAEAIIDAYQNPVDYYFTEPTFYEGTQWQTGYLYVSIEVGHPAPPNTTTVVPPALIPVGQTLYWYDGAWVVSSFNPNLALPAAKTSLIHTVNTNAAEAVNAEVALYSTVQQIEAPSVGALDTLTYPGTTIGDYQTYVDGLTAAATATINAATSTSDLYSFNPAEIPFTPAASGVLNVGRGAFGDPDDLNNTTMMVWSANFDATDTELFAPSTGTVMPFGGTVGVVFNYDSVGPCFSGGNYDLQLRQTSTGFVLFEFECPAAGVENVDVYF